MKITSESFKPGSPIPERFALCKKDPSSHVTFAGNESPQLAWSDLPAGTRSLVLICHDSDAPTRADDVNKEGRTVPASLARADFTHWVLVDLPATHDGLAAGAFSSGVTAHGKSGPEAPLGTRVGLNSSTQWFEGDKDMAGRYFGYDGPCPPWNDELVHHYHFTLYALDVARCPVDGVFTREQVLDAIKGHVLGQASLVGTYTLNPKLG
jgi:Raf kinase inhibitor-like YbhB/YbcL family protein